MPTIDIAPFDALSPNELGSISGGGPDGPNWGTVLRIIYGELDDFVAGFSAGYAAASR